MNIPDERKKELLLAVATTFEQRQPLNLSWTARHSVTLAEVLWVAAEVARVLREAAER